TPGMPIRGMLHSDALTSVERVRFDPETNRLVVSIEFDDPVFFTRRFPPATATYLPSSLEIQPFGCRPENPDHTLLEEKRIDRRSCAPNCTSSSDRLGRVNA